MTKRAPPSPCSPLTICTHILPNILVYANTLLAAYVSHIALRYINSTTNSCHVFLPIFRLNSRRSLNDRAAINVAGTDVFGTDVRRQGSDRADTQVHAPVSLELKANTQSSGEHLRALHRPQLQTSDENVYVCRHGLVRLRHRLGFWCSICRPGQAQGGHQGNRGPAGRDGGYLLSSTVRLLRSKRCEVQLEFGVPVFGR